MNEVVGNVVDLGDGRPGTGNDRGFWAFLIVAVILVVVWDRTVGSKK